MDYKNKVVLITGISSTIGISLLEFFLEAGAHVIVTYYSNKNYSYKIKNQYEKKYHINIDCIFLDLCCEKSINELFEYVKNKYGKLDILINNAALSMDNYYDDKSKKEFMKVLETNVVGTFLIIKYFKNIMHKGYIFNISSTDGIDTGNVYSIDYNASKAAINSLTKTFSLDSDNIIVSICPNWVKTKSTESMDSEYLKSELKRVGQEKLINPKTIGLVIDKCIKEKIESGSIIRIEGDSDVQSIN